MSDTIHEFRKVIDDPKAPARLFGKTVTMWIDYERNRLSFKVDLPEDATAQEVGYVRWYVGEFVDKLRDAVPNMIGDKREETIL